MSTIQEVAQNIRVAEMGTEIQNLVRYTARYECNGIYEDYIAAEESAARIRELYRKALHGERSLTHSASDDEIWYACIYRYENGVESRGNIAKTLAECHAERDRALAHPIHPPIYLRTVRVIRTAKNGDVTHPEDQEVGDL